ncbi:MAG: hypothetical protein Q4D42_02975 [Eubacteriales bacterium]|nr:hypothetical protein [Eubacteriales bacterium]
MFERYIDYRRAVIAILQNRQQAAVELENARAAYADVCQTLDGVGAVDSGAGGSGGGETTFIKKLERKEMLEQKIAVLETEEQCIQRALNALSSEERAIIEALYTVKHKSKPHAQQAACEAACCERSQMYRLRATALNKLERMIFLG